MSQQLELLWNHLLVKQDSLPDHIHQIVLPQARKQRPISGVVVAVGKSGSEEYRSGDRVLFAEYAGHQFKIDGQDLLLLNPGEVLARIPKEAVVDAAD